MVEGLAGRAVQLPPQEAAAKTDRDCVCSVSCSQLGAQVTHVRLHGFSGDDKLLGDLVILEAVCDQLQDLEFATRELFHFQVALTPSGNLRLSSPLPLPRPANVLEGSVLQRPSHRNRDVAVAIAATLALTS
jgi:hypothetical protein